MDKLKTTQKVAKENKDERENERSECNQERYNCRNERKRNENRLPKKLCGCLTDVVDYFEIE